MPAFDVQPGHVSAAPAFDIQPGHIEAAAPAALTPRQKMARSLDSLLPKDMQNPDATEQALALGPGMLMPEIPGVRQAAGWLGEKLLPVAEKWRGAVAQRVLDASTKAPTQTLRSATGTLGAATAEGSRTLERLGMTEGLPAAEQAANQAALQHPDAQALATDLAGKARQKLPGQLGGIQNARSLVDEAGKDLANAQTPEALAATEGGMRKYANDTLLKRYLLPAAVGGVTGAVLGGDEHAGTGALGGISMGLAGRPMLRAIVRQASNPGYAAPMSRNAANMAERMVQFAQTSPKALGKFAPILISAAQRGADALSVTHYLLQQDPAYVEAQRIASEDQK